MADESAQAQGASDGAGAAASTAPALVNLTSEQLKARLDETREAARAAFLKELGLPSIAEGKKAFEALKKLEQERMTEQEKLAARVKELEPYVDTSKRAQERYAAIVQRQFEALPEGVRNAIDEQIGADADPEKREQLMAFYAKVGASGASESATAQPKPANAGATSPAPKPASVKSKFDEWTDLEKRDPFGASLFYQNNSREIERTRPAQ